MTDETFDAGHVFFRPGDPGERAYLLAAGQVEVLAGPPEGLVRVSLFEAGEVLWRNGADRGATADAHRSGRDRRPGDPR